MKLIAFLIIIDGFGDMVACAATEAKARYVAWRSAQEAGYSSVTFGRIRSRRWPQLDRWAENQEKPAIAAREQAEWLSRSAVCYR
jgi:hypothetical protein